MAEEEADDLALLWLQVHRPRGREWHLRASQGGQSLHALHAGLKSETHLEEYDAEGVHVGLFVSYECSTLTYLLIVRFRHEYLRGDVETRTDVRRLVNVVRGGHDADAIACGRVRRRQAKISDLHVPVGIEKDV